jgi:hypothetical protein
MFKLLAVIGGGFVPAFSSLLYEWAFMILIDEFVPGFYSTKNSCENKTSAVS